MSNHISRKHPDKPMVTAEAIQKRVEERRQERARFAGAHRPDEEVELSISSREIGNSDSGSSSADQGELVLGLGNWSDHGSDAQSRTTSGDDIIPDRERQSGEEHVELYPDSGKRLCPIAEYDNHPCLDDPFQPFAKARAFSMANEMVQNNWADKQIDRWFNGGNQPNSSELGFQSAHVLQKHLDAMDGHLPSYKEGKVVVGGRSIKFFFRDPVACAAYLLEQRSYKKHLSYAPRREYTEAEGERVYSEMCTGDWWWETQGKLLPGATIIPIICSSDETHLTNFSGDQKAWPLYLTIGNLDSVVRNKPSYLGYITLALLPVPPKFQGISTTLDDKLRREAQAALFHVATHIFQPLHKHTESGIQLPCADGFIRHCHPVLASYIADHSEQTKNLHAVNQLCCPKCEVPARATGQYISEPELFAMRCQQNKYTHKYRALQAATEKADITEIEGWFRERGAHPRRNLFWDLPLVDSYDLHRPDILHNLHLGIPRPSIPFIPTVTNTIHFRYDKTFHGLDTNLPEIPQTAKLVRRSLVNPVLSWLDSPQ